MSRELNPTQQKDLLAAKEKAKREAISLPIAAMSLHPQNITNEIYWRIPVNITEDEHSYIEADLLPYGGWLAEFARSVATSIQFPPNTAFLHLLGIIACGTAKSFRYEYYGDEAAVNLYVVTAQPSSSGKSGVHRRYTVPFQIALKEFNAKNAVAQNKIQAEIDSIEATIKEQEKGGNSDPELHASLAEKIEERDKLNRIEFAFDDITPEAAEAAAVRQNGLINIASPEADALNIILGDVYKGQSTKANYGMFLKTWDTEWHSPSRITRSTKAGFVYGSVAIIAQATAIDAILAAGMTGRGISERMLLLNERPVMGYRDHASYTPIDRELIEKYDSLCRNIINESEPVTLKLSRECIDEIVAFRQAIEPKLADGGEYSNAMIRGSMGKADKQIIKIACLLHIAEQWEGQYATRNPNVTVDCVKNAISIFDQLSRMYVAAAESLGYAGEKPELECVIDTIEKLARKRKLKVNFRQLRDSVKNLKALKNVPQVTKKVRDEILPQLEKFGYVAIDGEEIYINPRLK